MRLEGRELWCKLILHSGIIIGQQGTGGQARHEGVGHGDQGVHGG